jgi:tRNA nucleotidyltransferase (CCA-adding enzyme)
MTISLFSSVLPFSETYAENSRIPEMSFGTPTEDAMRRDLTINSLFYNIHSKSVEDYSGRGVQDLKTGTCHE